MALPDNSATFTVRVIGEVSQEEYVGEFSCVCVPTAGARNAIIREELRITGDYENVPGELLVRGRWIANCRGRITSGPIWWKESRGGEDLMDDNVLKEVYDKALEAESKWREEVKQKAEALRQPL